MKVCDLHDDTESARADMKRECLAIPPHLQADLYEHLRSVSLTTFTLKGKLHE